MLLALLAFIGYATSSSESINVPYENPSAIEERNLTFDMQQSVKGTGFFAAYRHSSMPDELGTEGLLCNGVEAKSNAHGSGTIDSGSFMYSESSYLNRSWINGAYDEDGEIIEDLEETTSIVEINEDQKMTYSPYILSVGRGYYQDHALSFDSLLSENIWIKNRDGLNFINNRVQSARRLDMLLYASSDAVNTSMDLDEYMIDGRAHFAAWQASEIPEDEEMEDEGEDMEGEGNEAEGNEAEAEAVDEASVLGLAMKNWHSPLFVLDEDYAGTYSIKKNLTLYNYEIEEMKDDAWLPCCNSGFSGMNAMDNAGRSVQGIFDCTCSIPQSGVKL